MGKLRIVELSNEMAASASNVGVSRGELYDFLTELGQAMPAANENIARTWKTIRDRMEQTMPLNPAAVQFIDSLVSAQSRIGQMSGEWATVVRTVHGEDMARHEAPRRNEEAWNV